jgi:phenylalanine ammonia-lyase
MQAAVKRVVAEVARKVLFADNHNGKLLPSRFYYLLLVVDRQPVFSYIDDATNPTYPLMQKLREVLVAQALQQNNYSK